MNREKLGIPELDDMLKGGLPTESIVGLSGPPGVGKSILTLHFLLEGARSGKKGLYINLEEPRKNINKMISLFDFAEEFRDLEEKGLIVIKCMSYDEYEEIFLDLFQKINQDNVIERIVIDSFNVFFLSALYSDVGDGVRELNLKRMINKAFSLLRKEKLTSLLVLEKTNKLEEYSIPYMLDGIIELDFLDLGVLERRMFIPKMRWTDQFRESRGFEIRSGGISVLPN